MTHLLLPQPIDHSYRGHKLALWILAFVVGMKILQSLVVFTNAYEIAMSADGIPLDTYPRAAAQTIVSLFAISGLSRLILSLLGVLALVRYRSAVPLILALLVLEYVGRELIFGSYGLVRTGSPIGPTVNLILFGLTVVGLALSLVRRGALDARE